MVQESGVNIYSTERLFSQVERLKGSNGWPGLQSRPPAPLLGVSDRRFAAIQALLEPIQNLILNPSHPARAKLYPLGELAGLFQTCNMLR